VISPVSVLKTYSASPMPFTSRPDAMPCYFVGWTGCMGETKSSLEFVIVMLALVSIRKCNSSGVDFAGKP
jgi:hypothetical protein